MWNRWPTRLFAGRTKKRIAKGEIVALVRPDGLGLEYPATTENISDQGVRVVTEGKWIPGELVLLNALKAGRRIRARVVYCERLSDNRFAIGLELSRPLEDATRPG
jgi:hypothetical protein